MVEACEGGVEEAESEIAEILPLCLADRAIVGCGQLFEHPARWQY